MADVSLSPSRATRLARRCAPVLAAGALALVAAGCGTPGAASPATAVDVETSGAEANPGSAAPSDGRPEVLLFGDSLTVEAGDAVVADLGSELDVRVHAFGGLALCDVVDQAVELAREDHPALVVVQFSGNALTPCMQPDGRAPTEAERSSLYRHAAERLDAELAALQVPLLFVGGPPMPGAGGGGSATDLAQRDIARAAADRGDPVGYVDAGAAVAGPDGGWVATLPCRPDEGAEQGCEDGRIAVRAADGVHFCPGSSGGPDGQVPSCLEWSSGAERYAEAVADGIRAQRSGLAPQG